MRKLIIVDIQPGYSEFLSFDMSDFIAWVDDSDFDEVHILFNGPDLGFEDEHELRFWYEEEYELSINFNIFEKNYAWFRNFMDQGISDDDVVAIGKYMIEHDIIDTRDFTESQIEKLNEKGVDTTLIETEDCMYIPELKDYLLENIYDNDKITICGGGENECLKEVELMLDMLDFKYEEKYKFIY